MQWHRQHRARVNSCPSTLKTGWAWDTSEAKTERKPGLNRIDKPRFAEVVIVVCRVERVRDRRDGRTYIRGAMCNAASQREGGITTASFRFILSYY